MSCLPLSSCDFVCICLWACVCVCSYQNRNPFVCVWVNVRCECESWKTPVKVGCFPEGVKVLPPEREERYREGEGGGCSTSKYTWINADSDCLTNLSIYVNNVTKMTLINVKSNKKLT